MHLRKLLKCKCPWIKFHGRGLSWAEPMSFYIHLSIVLNPFSRKIITSSFPPSSSSKLNHNIALLIVYSISLPGGNPTRSDCQRLGLEEQHQGNQTMLKIVLIMCKDNAFETMAILEILVMMKERRLMMMDPDETAEKMSVSCIEKSFFTARGVQGAGKPLRPIWSPVGFPLRQVWISSESS